MLNFAALGLVVFGFVDGTDLVLFAEEIEGCLLQIFAVLGLPSCRNFLHVLLEGLPTVGTPPTVLILAHVGDGELGPKNCAIEVKVFGLVEVVTAWLVLIPAIAFIRLRS